MNTQENDRDATPALAAAPGSAWSRRYICIACGHKGRMSAGQRGDTIFCSKCLKSQPASAIKEQADTYRNEDNGDDSMWSIYNRGRSDALDALLPNDELCEGGPQSLKSGETRTRPSLH